MKNAAPYIRKQLKTLLFNNVQFNGDDVPVYEGEGVAGENQVIIGGYSDTDQSNKHCRTMLGVQDIEIVTVKRDATSKASDEIAETVMNLIHPTVDSDLWSVPEFQIVVKGGPSMLQIREDSYDGQKVVRRLLRYNLLIEEL